MMILLALPVWVAGWWLMLKPSAKGDVNRKTKQNTRVFEFMCVIAVIFIMGLRHEYTGTLDTHNYFLLFGNAKSRTDFWEYMSANAFKDGVSVLGEPAFFTYVWLAARVLPSAQWFLLLSSSIVVLITARFIKNNSDDFGISWIVFICLGPMTFAMNAMRQTLAMSICLIAYDYAKKRKLIPFALVVFVAFLFHKSAMVFAVVYLVQYLKLNFKSVTLLAVMAGALLMFANNIAVLYDSVVGEDYAESESFESGGVSTILIYAAILLFVFLFSKRLKQPEIFALLVLVVLGFVLYLCRFVSAAIYERISNYFFYFVMILLPSAISDMNKKDRGLVLTIFVLVSVALFAYRINASAFSNFKLFW